MVKKIITHVQHHQAEKMYIFPQPFALNKAIYKQLDFPCGLKTLLFPTCLGVVEEEKTPQSSYQFSLSAPRLVFWQVKQAGNRTGNDIIAGDGRAYPTACCSSRDPWDWRPVGGRGGAAGPTAVEVSPPIWSVLGSFYDSLLVFSSI